MGYPQTLPIVFPDGEQGRDHSVLIGLFTSGDVAVTGKISGDVVVDATLKPIGTESDVSFSGVLQPGEWEEIGAGWYIMTVTSRVVTKPGNWIFKLSVATAEDIYGMVTMRKSVDNGKAWCSAQYNHTTNTLDFTSWLEKGGEKLTDPTSTRIIVKRSSDGVVIADVTSASPNADGRFYISKNPVSLADNTNYFIETQVVHKGNTYTGGVGLITFN